jgi:hypothetical protein
MATTWEGHEMDSALERARALEVENARLRAILQSIINGYEWPKELARRELEGGK